jgi:hypothetical protein
VVVAGRHVRLERAPHSKGPVVSRINSAVGFPRSCPIFLRNQKFLALEPSWIQAIVRLFAVPWMSPVSTGPGRGPAGWKLIVTELLVAQLTVVPVG